MRPEVLEHDSSEVLFSGAIGGTVIVGKVEVRDTAVEGITQNVTLGRERPVVAEVVPEAHRHRRQLQSRLPHAPILEIAIAIGRGAIRVVRRRNVVVSRNAHGYFYYILWLRASAR